MGLRGDPATAAEAYATATRHWPEQAAGWFGLANSHYALGRYAEAETALRSLLKREPGLAMAWNNLAHVLAARGCGAQARQAAARALRVEPHDTRYRSTAEQMQEVTEGECFNGVRLD
ncbi:MAG: tetratricopeptide repeat protein [Xanthomonadaceae bacterium]|nr:tetratricopeptide repeat protein [Xanthomonadaceae bacterium]